MVIERWKSDLEGLLDTAEEETGSRLETRPKLQMNVWSVLQKAHEVEKPHVLVYDREYERFLPYMQATACVRLLRFARAPPESQIKPATSQKTYSCAYERVRRELEELGLSNDLMNKYFRQIYEGIVRQVHSMSSDCRIEPEVWKKYPSFREFQQEALELQVRENGKVLSVPREMQVPKLIYEASVAMNSAHAHVVGELLQKQEVAELFGQASESAKARLLLRSLNRVEEGGYAGDVQLADAWTSNLGLEGWYEWTRG